ncbi:MAG TPA: hypothetical protein VMU84_09270 [Thermoanaerobaculia bacterium]|nr:hypothetical protein [Thermoanaerobaculia bacterium]
MKQRALNSEPAARPDRLYQGYDTIADAGRSSALTPGGPDSSSDGVFNEVANIFIGADSVMQAMGIAASESSLFDFGAEDARVAFVQNFGLTELSVTVLVHANLRATKEANLNPPTLTAGPPSDLQKFFAAYGDSYVNYVEQGSWYCAMYVFYAVSEDEQTSVVGQLAGLGITEEGLLSGSAQFNLSQCQQKIATSSTFNQTLLGFANPQTPDEGGILEFANTQFAKLVADLPVTFTYKTTGYERVPQMPASFQSVVTSRNLFTGQGPTAGLGANYASLTDAANAIDHLKTVYQTYGVALSNDPTLVSRAAQIETDRIALYDVIAAMEIDPTQTYAAPSAPSLQYGLPSLQLTTHVSPFWGGPGGSPWQDADATSVGTAPALSSVSVWGINHVHQISSTFVTQGAKVPQTHVYTHGGGDGKPGGEATLSLQLPSDGVELINSISVFTSWDSSQRVNAIQQLNIGTTLGKTLMWPGSITPGQPPGDGWGVWTPGPNEVFVGFNGRSGYVMDSLGVISATILPAAWSGSQPAAERDRVRPRRSGTSRRRAQVNA